MREIEVKILEINPTEIEAKLLSLGAVKIDTRQLVDRNFDNANQDIKRKKEVLRLRRDGERDFLTFKTNRAFTDVRSSDEYETEISNSEAVVNILRGLGYEQVKHREKIRTTYTLTDVTFEIDQYPSIPPYLEIEGSESAIQTIIPQLGYTMADTTTMTATQVLKHYGADSGLVSKG